jgi:hypothetical protein
VDELCNFFLLGFLLKFKFRSILFSHSGGGGVGGGGGHKKIIGLMDSQLFCLFRPDGVFLCSFAALRRSMKCPLTAKNSDCATNLQPVCEF